MRFNYLLKWLRILGVLLFFWIATKINWATVFRLLLDIKLEYLALYFFVFLIAVFFKILRLKWILNKVGFTASYRTVYLFVVEPAFYGMITPARLGEFSKVIYLRNFGLTQKTAWSLVLLERIIDFTVLFIVSVAGCLYFFAPKYKFGLAISVCAMLFALFVLVLANSTTIIMRYLPSIARNLLNKSDESTANEVANKLDAISSAACWIILPISIAILILSFGQLSILAYSLGSNVSGFHLSLAYVVSSMAALLPISIGGLGTREAIYISILSENGISNNVAVAISLLDGLVFGLLFIAILFIPILLLKKLFLKKEKNDFYS